MIVCPFQRSVNDLRSIQDGNRFTMDLRRKGEALPQDSSEKDEDSVSDKDCLKTVFQSLWFHLVEKVLPFDDMT